MDEICYSGSHGTSMTHYTSILKSGFRASHGRGGTGIYFWLKSRAYLKLARAWFEHKKNGGHYRHESNPKCVIIIATLKASSLEFIDLEEQEFKDMIYDVSEEMRIDINDIKIIAKLHDAVINKFEQRSGFAIKMYTVRVAPPKNCTYVYPIATLGAPVCCIARAPEIITIESTQNCDQV